MKGYIAQTERMDGRTDQIQNKVTKMVGTHKKEGDRIDEIDGQV
jgi:hypothetical protein